MPTGCEHFQPDTRLRRPCGQYEAKRGRAGRRGGAEDSEAFQADMQDVARIARQEDRDAAQENREQIEADRAEDDLGGPHIVQAFDDERPARGGRRRLTRR